MAVVLRLGSKPQPEAAKLRTRNCELERHGGHQANLTQILVLLLVGRSMHLVHIADTTGHEETGTLARHSSAFESVRRRSGSNT